MADNVPIALIEWLSERGRFNTLHHEIVNEIRSQSDRSAAILAGSMVDERLTEAVKSKLVVNDRVTKHLFSSYEAFTFSVKNRLCYGLGFYGRQTFRDIKKIKWVRNKFAHALLSPDDSGKHSAFSFDTKQIADVCKKIKVISMLSGTEKPELLDQPPREIYISTTIIIVIALGFLLSGEIDKLTIGKKQSFKLP